MTLETSLQGKKIVKQNSDMCILICVINKLFLVAFVCIIPTCMGLKQQSWKTFAGLLFSIGLTIHLPQHMIVNWPIK